MKTSDFAFAAAAGLIIALLLYGAYTAEPKIVRQARYIAAHSCKHTAFVGSSRDGFHKVYTCDTGLKLDTDF